MTIGNSSGTDAHGVLDVGAKVGPESGPIALRTRPVVLFEDEKTSLTYVAGSSARMVVMFIGLADKFGDGVTAKADVSDPEEEVRRANHLEFLNTLRADGENHLIFARDKSMGWYSREGQDEILLREIANKMRDLGATALHTVGYSMGAHAAILFAERLGAESAIGFAPQFTMRPGYLKDWRWAEMVRSIPADRLETLDDRLTGKVRAYAIFGSNCPPDKPHIAACRASGRIRVFEVPGAAHNVTKVLKDRGQIGPVIRLLFENNPDEVEAVLSGRQTPTGSGTDPVQEGVG